MPRPPLKLILAALLALWAVAPAFGAGPQLTLQLTDGSRVHVGEIADVNEAGLTVAAVGEGIRIERTLAWHRIADASLHGQRYSLRELQLAAGLSPKQVQSVSYAGMEQLPAPHPILLDPTAYAGGSPVFHSPFAIPYSPFLTVGRVIGVRADPLSAYADLEPAIYPNGIPSIEAPFALGLLRERRRVETIGPFLGPVAPTFGPTFPVPTGDATPGDLSQIEARVIPIRRGGTADINALGVELVGFDEAGRPVPVDGTGQFFLYAGEQRLVRAFDNAYAAQPEGLVRLAEWTRNVTPDASLVLRLPEPLPEHDPTISPIGTLRVRLSVPGRGVFETIAEPVTLRPASPLRDSLRGETGSRFLPDEKTSGRPNTAWPRQPDLSRIE
ncbi:MAG: hypothetical protein M3552_19750 [Planctomycetota bacterium]|nr:hypothetical protein [Planctomycetaceae bacterium]MDQ3332852.1 hypothetical protein [Planctomycetota bacterium]